MATLTLPTDVRDALVDAVATYDRYRDEWEHPDLADRLYATWYAAAVAPLELPEGLPGDLGQMFRAVHAGSEPWEEGWAAESTGRAGEVVAVRGTERILLERSDYVATERPGMMALPGDDLLVPARRDHIDLETGWWFTHSPGWRLDAPEGPLVRLYWNVGAGQVATLVQVLSAAVTRTSERWMLKCALAPEAYVRADAAVLFLPRTALDRLHGGIDRSRSMLSEVLRPTVPPLTLRAAPGLGVCDDPGTGESFGQHRCRLIAEAVSAVEPSERGGGRIERMLHAVIERFRSEGIPEERPYVSEEGRVLPWE